MLASLSGSNELVTSLIENGANVNASQSRRGDCVDDRGAGNHSAIAGLLLKSGADANARSEDGRTALSIARRQQQ